MSRHRKLIIIIPFVCFITGFVAGMYVGNTDIPFLSMSPKYGWSIGIFSGDTPFNLSCSQNCSNPVLTADDVTDIPADFVADPFMVEEDSTWYMFFEVMNNKSKQGDIGLAISNDGLNWIYKQIVLDESFHLSYPYIFKWENNYYMIPETCKANCIRLYKAIDFPGEWSLVATLLEGDTYIDSSILHYERRWWLFTATSNDTLRLYYANNLVGPWIEHCKSPIVEGDGNIARPGGRVAVFDGRIVRYTQDDDPTYGNQVRAFEITTLTEKAYVEQEVDENPILQPSGSGWNGEKMHHIDPHQTNDNKWIACVDGYGRYGKALVLRFSD